MDLMLGFNETLDLLVMTNSVHCYGYVLLGDGGHFLRRTLDFEVKV